MAAKGRRLECLGEIRVTRVRAIVAAHAFGDELRDCLDCELARLFALLSAADTISDHHQGCEPIFDQRQLGELGKAGLNQVEALPEGGDEEMVLIGRAHESAVGNAEDVDFVIAGFAKHGSDLSRPT